MRVIASDRQAAAVDATDTVVVAAATFEGQCTDCWLDLANAGATALSGLRVQLKSHPAAPWRDVYVTADFAPGAPGTGVLKAGTPQLSTLAGGASSYARVDMTGAHALQAIAKTAAGATTVNAYLQASSRGY